MATEVPGEDGQPGYFMCQQTWAETSAENDDIRAEATDAEDPSTYHAWQWSILVELEFQWPVEESEPEDQEEADEEAEEEAGHMLAATAVATVAAYMISQI